jgi:hypothetical protein
MRMTRSGHCKTKERATTASSNLRQPQRNQAQRWSHLVADPTFLRRCWPASAHIGFFTQHSRDQYDPAQKQHHHPHGCACLRPSAAISPHPHHPDPRLFRPRRRHPPGTRDAALPRPELLQVCITATLWLSVCNPLAGSTRDLLRGWSDLGFYTTRFCLPVPTSAPPN